MSKCHRCRARRERAAKTLQLLQKLIHGEVAIPYDLNVEAILEGKSSEELRDLARLGGTVTRLLGMVLEQDKILDQQPMPEGGIGVDPPHPRNSFPH